MATATAIRQLTRVAAHDRQSLLSPLHQDLTPPTGPNMKGEKTPESSRGGNVRQVVKVFFLRVAVRIMMFRVRDGRRWRRNQKVRVAVREVVQ